MLKNDFVMITKIVTTKLKLTKLFGIFNKIFYYIIKYFVATTKLVNKIIWFFQQNKMLVIY